MSAVEPTRAAGGSALKQAVKDHWEQETCGVRYGDGEERLAWFRTIAEKRYELEPYIPDFAQFAEGQGKKVLEIGVGAGSDFLNWARNAGHATGVDLTEAGIALTRERLTLEQIDPARFALQPADAENLPFETGSFDIVYSWGVLHHTPDTRKAYSEVLRVLKPGGRMRTMVYQVPSWTGFMLYLLHGVAKGKIGLGQRGAMYAHLESAGTKSYTVAEARELATSLGYKDVVVSTKLGPGDLLTIAPSARYNSWPFKLAFMFWPRWLIRMLGDKYGLYLLLEGRKPE